MIKNNCIPGLALGHHQMNAPNRRKKLNTYNTVFQRHFQGKNILLLTNKSSMRLLATKSSLNMHQLTQTRAGTRAHEPL